MIKFDKLTKKFRTDEIETTVLQDIDLTIDKGDFVAVMGPSGSGKSTLLNVLGLLDNFSGGDYHFLDENIKRYSSKQRALVRKHNIGFVFQSFNLINTLSVFENIELPLIYQGMKKTERKERVDRVLEKMDISHRAKHYPHQLSGGQQQRVAVARAVVGDPKIILADEPTGNLDSKNGKDVMGLFEKLNQSGTTIVMVTHSEHDAGYASKLIRLADGQLA